MDASFVFLAGVVLALTSYCLWPDRREQADDEDHVRP